MTICSRRWINGVPTMNRSARCFRQRRRNCIGRSRSTSQELTESFAGSYRIVQQVLPGASMGINRRQWFASVAAGSALATVGCTVEDQAAVKAAASEPLVDANGAVD